MSSGTPIVKQIAWISLIPQFGLMVLFALIYYMLGIKDFPLWAAVTYLVLSVLLRLTVAGQQRMGIRCVRKEQYEAAIEHFQKSYDFFKRHHWVDKYRFITMLSSSRISFKEMALNNIAYCYGQMGDGVKAREYYERTLQEFPDSEMAKAALNFLNSANGYEEEEDEEYTSSKD